MNTATLPRQPVSSVCSRCSTWAAVFCVWASASDWIGRKNTYFIFFALGAVLYYLVPGRGFWARSSSCSPTA